MVRRKRREFILIYGRGTMPTDRFAFCEGAFRETTLVEVLVVMEGLGVEPSTRFGPVGADFEWVAGRTRAATGRVGFAAT